MWVAAKLFGFRSPGKQRPTYREPFKKISPSPRHGPSLSPVVAPGRAEACDPEQQEAIARGSCEYTAPLTIICYLLIRA